MSGPELSSEWLRKLNLPEDPDDRTRRWGWYIWWLWLVAGGALTASAVRSGGLTIWVLVFLAPFWGVWLLWLCVRGGIWVRGWLGATVWGQWNGNYFEYDGRQIRILFDGPDIFVATADVLSVCGIEGRSRELDRVRMVAGRNGVVPVPGARLMCFTERGLMAWLEGRSDSQCVKFQRWFVQHVVRPYRQRCKTHV